MNHRSVRNAFSLSQLLLQNSHIQGMIQSWNLRGHNLKLDFGGHNQELDCGGHKCCFCMKSFLTLLFTIGNIKVWGHSPLEPPLAIFQVCITIWKILIAPRLVNSRGVSSPSNVRQMRLQLENHSLPREFVDSMSTLFQEKSQCWVN